MSAATVYQDTVTATEVKGRSAPGTDPLTLRCDSPGHGDVTGDWALAAEDGWDLGAGDPAALRRCPQCVKAIQDATREAQARGEAEEAEKCAAVRDWEAGGQLVAFPLPRWMAAAPAATPPRKGAGPAARLYGTYADSAAISKLIAACDDKYGPVNWAAAATAASLILEPEPEPTPPVAHEEDPQDPAAEDAPLGELNQADQEHMAAFLSLHGVHDGDTATIPAVTDAEQEQPA